MNAGDTCLFIGTEAHRISLEKGLGDRGIDLDVARTEGRYAFASMRPRQLSNFMVDEWPDEALFSSHDRRHSRKHVEAVATFALFGEMVALLWAHGQSAGGGSARRRSGTRS